MADETCKVFGRLSLNLDRTKIHRFIVGADRRPQPMAADEANRDLGDPFARLLLLKGVFPRTAEDCLREIDKAARPSSPLRRQMSFLLGETSQLPATARVQRSIRFVITRGADANGPPEGPDILLSASFPGQTDIELMAWDRKRGGFNYYRAVGDGPTWVFAGNSRHALVDPTEGKGPFESHKSGAFLMKELKLPWINWHSPEAPIRRRDFPPNDPRLRHPWFVQREPGGAYTFEFAVARPAIERWARARFDGLAAAGTIDRPRRIIEQILDTPTANLASSNVESRRAATSPGPVDLPPSFFADVDCLTNELGLAPPPDLFAVPGNVYARTLRKFNVRLDDRRGFVQQGDTHFAFAVPEPAFEDVVALREALRIGLVTPRLAASLLMVDFPNPIFSPRRTALLKHVPASATVRNGRSTFSQEMADAILTAPEATDAGSPESEFAERWNAGNRFRASFNRLLSNYYRAVIRRLGTHQGFDDYFRLAESRRRTVRRNPIFAEFALVFARSDVPEGARSMRPDGTVA